MYTTNRQEISKYREDTVKQLDLTFTKHSMQQQPNAHSIQVHHNIYKDGSYYEPEGKSQHILKDSIYIIYVL